MIFHDLKFTKYCNYTNNRLLSFIEVCNTDSHGMKFLDVTLQTEVTHAARVVAIVILLIEEHTPNSPDSPGMKFLDV